MAQQTTSTTACRCDPPGSGEEHCTRACYREKAIRTAHAMLVLNGASWSEGAGVYTDPSPANVTIERVRYLVEHFINDCDWLRTDFAASGGICVMPDNDDTDLHLFLDLGPLGVGLPV